MKCKAAILYELNKPFVIDTVEIDDPQEGEVRVKIEACSICHTDQYVRETGATVNMPAVLGHEGAGVIEKVGPGVKNFKVGDRVALTVPHCGHCPACRRGEYLSCENNFSMYFGRPDGRPRLRDKNGTPLGHLMGQGSFAEYVVVYESSCIPLDDDISFETAAPVGCGFSTGSGTVLNFLKPHATDSIAVFGCGSTGFASIMGAKLAGCHEIIAIGRSDEKLAIAKELGATHVINSKKLEEEQGYTVEVTGPEAVFSPVRYPLVDAIKALTKGKGVNFSVVTAPVQKVITPAIFSLASGGECCVTASLPEGVVPFQFMQGGNIRISSCGMGCANKYVFFPYLLEEFKKGNYPIDKLEVSYSFDNIEQAFADMESGKSIKPVLHW